MNTVINLKGFEFPDPDQHTPPDVQRTIGPMSDVEGATAWLTKRRFISKGGPNWYRGHSVFQRRGENGTMISANCACVYAKVVIVDHTTDVDIND